MFSIKAAAWMGIVLGAIAAGIAAAAWPSLPNPMPVHFDLHGVANGFAPRAVGAFLIPALIAATGLLFALSVRISPAGFALRPVAKTVAVIAIAAELFLLGTHALVLRAAAHHAPLSGGLLMLGLGALLAVLGNQLGKVRRNFFLGIRTPWTLADEEVWLRTHRVGGKVFVAAGLVTMLLGLVTANVLAMVAVVLIAALVPVAYSFAVYRHLHTPART